MNNPEDADELNIYKRLTDIERRLDQIDENHNKLRDDYTYGRKGGRRKTRKKKRSRKKKRRRKRRKTRRKSAGSTPDFYKKRVDREEDKKQWKLNRKMRVAIKNHNYKEQAKIKKKLKKSFERQKYYNTPGHAENKEAIVKGLVRNAGPAIDDSLRRGLLVRRKPRKLDVTRNNLQLEENVKEKQNAEKDK